MDDNDRPTSRDPDRAPAAESDPLDQQTWWFGPSGSSGDVVIRRPVGPGTRLGRYQVRGLLGAGGMGQVYDAYDESLDREVALKALGATFGDDSAGLRRLEREAKVLAALSHPNIATIYGFEELDQAAYLVLEKVDGGTLGKRLEAGPLSVRQAVGIAIQVARGLAEAHGKGVIHRDLKPSNVMLGSSGRVKLVDFGLAKSLERGPNDLAASNLTAVDAIVGTAPYMSPEQIRGDELDTRTDVWAFGCLLFEMLSGRPPFVGRSSAETLAAILRDEPPYAPLVASLPPSLLRLIRRCLTKEIEHRPQHIDDLALELVELAGELDHPSQQVVPLVVGRRQRPWVGWVASAAAGAVVVGLVALGMASLAPASASQPLALSLELPRGLELDDGYRVPFALAPDGNSVVVVAADEHGSRLYRRNLGEPEVTALASTEGAHLPFFSPDGRELAFFTERKLVKLSLADGTVIPLAELGTNARGAAWLADGSIVVAPSQTAGLMRLSARGDDRPTPLTQLDIDAGEASHRWPEVLPGGRWVLYTVGFEGRSYDEARIDAVSPSTGERRTVLAAGSYPRYASSGHLLFVHSGRVHAVAFDPITLEVDGPPLVVLPGVRYDPQNGSAHLATSRSDGLLYAPGLPMSPEVHLAWLDPTGQLERLPGAARAYRDVRVAPSGSRVALVVGTWADSDLRVLAADGSLTQLTFGLSPHRPAWAPDGRTVTVSALRDGRWRLLSVDTEVPGEPDVLYESVRQVYPCAWTPDGRQLVFQEHHPTNGWDLLVLDRSNPAGPATTRSWTTSPFHETNAAISPDGKFVAYESDELDGLVQVSVRRFADATARTVASTAGARWPVWGGDGRLYSWDTSQRRLVVANVVERDGDLVVEGEQPLLTEAVERATLPRIVVAVNGARFDIDPTGSRLLVRESLVRADGPTLRQPILLLGWQARLQASGR